MSEKNGKVCCSCGNCERIKLGNAVSTICAIDGHYIGYVECFEHWCRHWKREKSFDKEDA